MRLSLTLLAASLFALTAAATPAQADLIAVTVLPIDPFLEAADEADAYDIATDSLGISRQCVDLDLPAHAGPVVFFDGGQADIVLGAKPSDNVDALEGMPIVGGFVGAGAQVSGSNCAVVHDAHIFFCRYVEPVIDGNLTYAKQVLRGFPATQRLVPLIPERPESLSNVTSQGPADPYTPAIVDVAWEKDLCTDEPMTVEANLGEMAIDVGEAVSPYTEPLRPYEEQVEKSAAQLVQMTEQMVNL